MSDIHDPTPWEDINPPMALAPQPEQHFPCLEPATSDQFRDELTACLILVVPVGMTEEARREWLVIAWETLKHLPAEILAYGCGIARKTADHPSKIVPAIVAATEEWMETRRSATRSSTVLYLGAPTKRDIMDRRGEAMSEGDCAELNDMLELLGATARYRADGSRYMIDGNT